MCHKHLLHEFLNIIQNKKMIIKSPSAELLLLNPAMFQLFIDLKMT